MPEQQLHGDAYAAVRYIYDKSPGRSWRRLNGALQDALTAAITAHLSFLPDDFAAIRRDMNGSYWMGNGYGSECGERYYNLAVSVGHTPACVSFERYAGRPAALWSEEAKTPKRLMIGSEFTWGTLKLTVTNIRQDHLIACLYGGGRYRGNDHAVALGDFESLHDGKYHRIEEFAYGTDGSLSVHFSGPVEDPYERKPDRVVKIKFAELAAARAAFEANRRKALAAIAHAENIEKLTEAHAEIASAAPGTYRHFDIEDIRKSVHERKREFEIAEFRAIEEFRREAHRTQLAASYESDLERWVNGEPARQWFHDVRLRVRNGRVETSTGQSASVESVCKVLPVVLRRRNSLGPVRNLMVDSFEVVEQTAAGVKVGCTLVPWPEVEHLAVILGGVALTA